jgi:hypothetical protein
MPAVTTGEGMGDYGTSNGNLELLAATLNRKHANGGQNHHARDLGKSGLGHRTYGRADGGG